MTSFPFLVCFRGKQALSAQYLMGDYLSDGQLNTSRRLIVGVPRSLTEFLAIYFDIVESKTRSNSFGSPKKDTETYEQMEKIDVLKRILCTTLC